MIEYREVPRRSRRPGIARAPDVLAVDPRHLHVGGVFLALGSGELAVELDPDLRVHSRWAGHVVRLETRLAGNDIDHRLRGSVRLDRGTASTDDHGRHGGKNQQCASHRRSIADQVNATSGPESATASRGRASGYPGHGVPGQRADPANEAVDVRSGPRHPRAVLYCILFRRRRLRRRCRSMIVGSPTKGAGHVNRPDALSGPPARGAGPHR